MPRKAIAHDFVLEALHSLQPRTRPMFGCTAVYVGEKIVAILRDGRTPPSDDGMWLATDEAYHDSLRAELPHMRSIGLFGDRVSGWQVLPSDAPDFEEAALRACEMIVARDPRIGRIPKARRSKKRAK
jgi:hypothetical protein